MRTGVLLLLPLLVFAFTAAAENDRQETDAPVTAKAYSPQIQSALDFLERDITGPEKSWQVYAFLDFLQRRFDLPEKYKFRNLCEGVIWSEDDEQLASFFGKLINPDHQIDCAAIPSVRANSLNHLMGHALACDECPLPPKYFALLQEAFEAELKAERPGYITTHLLLCRLWLEELHCPCVVSAVHDKEQFVPLLLKIIEQNKGATDLAFEAMALLFYIGEGKEIKPEWLENLGKVQTRTGGWGYQPGFKPEGHPTMLALWVLLEKENPAVTPGVRMLRPSKKFLVVDE